MEPLSGGMKRRLTIARSLVNDPDLLLLDEPTTGLDPQARHVVWDRLFRLKQQGKTFVVTTHYMDEAEQLCDRLVVMDHGSIVAEGSPWELIQRYSTREVVEIRFEDERPQNGVFEGVAERVEELPDRVLLYTRDGDATAIAVAERGLPPHSTLVRREHARGRLPPPHRPDAGRLGDGQRPPAAAGVRALARPVPARLARHDRDEPRQPDPLPDGARDRARHDRRPDAERAGRRPVPRLRRPGPARRRGDADGHDRVELAGDGRDQVVARLPRDDRDAADRAGRLRRPPAVRDHAGVHVRGRLPRRSSPRSAPSRRGRASSSSRSPC